MTDSAEDAMEKFDIAQYLFPDGTELQSEYEYTRIAPTEGQP